MTTEDKARKPGLVLFLGSGFSSALGLPTTDQVADRLLDPTSVNVSTKPVEDFVSATIGEFWARVFGWRPGMPPPTLGEHFTQIDLAANSGHHLGTSYDPRRLRAIRRMTIHRVLSLLRSEGWRHPQVNKFIQDLVAAFDVAIITTNWDAEIESCFEYAGLHFVDGLDETDLSDAVGRKAEPPVPILKLHGCINRGYCDCCRTIVRFVGFTDATTSLRLLLNAGDFELFDGGKDAAGILRAMEGAPGIYTVARSCGVCGVRLKTRVATFSFRKDLNPEAFHVVWDRAREHLQKATKWLFIGYSLPEEDIEIRHLLKSSQLARRDPSSLSIDVVLKDDNAPTRYKRFFGLDGSQVFTDGIEEWISKCLGDYCVTDV